MSIERRPPVTAALSAARLGPAADFSCVFPRAGLRIAALLLTAFPLLVVPAFVASILVDIIKQDFTTGWLTALGLAFAFFAPMAIATLLIWLAVRVPFYAAIRGGRLTLRSLLIIQRFSLQTASIHRLLDDAALLEGIAVRSEAGAWSAFPHHKTTAADKLSLEQMLTHLASQGVVVRTARTTFAASRRRMLFEAITEPPLQLLLAGVSFGLTLVLVFWGQVLLLGAPALVGFLFVPTVFPVLAMFIAFGPTRAWLLKLKWALTRENRVWNVRVEDGLQPGYPFRTTATAVAIHFEKDRIIFAAPTPLEISRPDVQQVRLQRLSYGSWPRAFRRNCEITWNDGGGVRVLALSSNHGSSFYADRKLDKELYNALVNWREGNEHSTPPMYRRFPPFVALLAILTFCFAIVPLHNSAIQRMYETTTTRRQPLLKIEGRITPVTMHLVQSPAPNVPVLATELPSMERLSLDTFRTWRMTPLLDSAELAFAGGAHWSTSLNGNFALQQDYRNLSHYRLPPRFKGEPLRFLKLNATTGRLDVVGKNVAPGTTDCAISNEGDVLWVAVRDHWQPGRANSATTVPQTLRDVYLERHGGSAHKVAEITHNAHQQSNAVFFPSDKHVLLANSVLNLQTGSVRRVRLAHRDEFEHQTYQSFEAGDKLRLRLNTSERTTTGTAQFCELWEIDPSTAIAQKIFDFPPGEYVASADADRWLVTNRSSGGIAYAFLYDHSTGTSTTLTLPHDTESAHLLKGTDEILIWTTNHKWRKVKQRPLL